MRLNWSSLLVLFVSYSFSSIVYAHRNHDHKGVCIRNERVMTLTPKNEVQRKAACQKAGGKWLLEEHDHDDAHAGEHGHCSKDGKQIDVKGTSEKTQKAYCDQQKGVWKAHSHEHSHEPGHGHVHDHK